MKYKYYIVDVFSSEPFGGNQLAVLPNATGLSTQGMQHIAREFNFAESSFVFPPESESATARVRIFTPSQEIDFAGHPTVGTACALVYGGHIDSRQVILEENIGPIDVQVSGTLALLSGTLTNSSKFDFPNVKPDTQQVAQVLGLKDHDVLDGFYASVGLDFCFVQLASRDTVDRAELNKTRWCEHMSNAWSKNMFFFSGELTDGNELYARMASPALGIEEDPATGSAAAALVGIAGKQSPHSQSSLTIDIIQGAKIGRLSKMTACVTLRDGGVSSVSVGGSTAMTASGDIDVPEKWLVH